MCILLIGRSKESWEKAAANAVEQASKSLRNLRVASGFTNRFEWHAC
jgi:flavin-binding protein dodecin